MFIPSRSRFVVGFDRFVYPISSCQYSGCVGQGVAIAGCRQCPVLSDRFIGSSHTRQF
jgi:hypothetical protein